MPTKAQLDELYATKSNTTDYTWEWTTVGGHAGYKITSKKSGTSGNSIFLPAAGLRNGTSLSSQGSYGSYWSSTLYEDLPNDAWRLYFESANDFVNVNFRCHGLPVRPVQ